MKEKEAEGLKDETKALNYVSKNTTKQLSLSQRCNLFIRIINNW